MSYFLYNDLTQVFIYFLPVFMHLNQV